MREQTKEEILQIFREFVIWTNYGFPENEEEVKWFDEGIKDQPAFILKVMETLDFGKLNDDELNKIDDIEYGEPPSIEKILQIIKRREN